MKYLVISHGHGDHHGGAKYLQDEFGPRVVMGAPDLGSRREEPARPDSAPRRCRIRWAENYARRHDRDVMLYAGTHSRNVLAHHPGQRMVAVRISSRRGEARRWEATRRLQG